MCKYFSCLVKRDLSVVWDKKDSSHETLVKKAKLKDDKLENRSFVRIELNPKGMLSENLSDWDYKVDEEGTLPAWYQKNEERAKKAVWIACQKSFSPYKKQIPMVNDFISSLKDIKWFSCSGKIDAKWHMSFGVNLAAAGDAAWDAALDAAWDAALFARCLLVKDKIAKKHFKHAKERMAVWKAGYGLRCDVKGKLYVYAVKKDGV